MKSMYDEIELSLRRRDVDPLKDFFFVAEGVAERCHDISMVDTRNAVLKSSVSKGGTTHDCFSIENL